MLDSGDFTDQQICIATGKSIEYIRELKKNKAFIKEAQLVAALLKY